jgi:hypothetical protein
MTSQVSNPSKQAPTLPVVAICGPGTKGFDRSAGRYVSLIRHFLCVFRVAGAHRNQTSF